MEPRSIILALLFPFLLSVIVTAGDPPTPSPSPSTSPSPSPSPSPPPHGLLRKKAPPNVFDPATLPPSQHNPPSEHPVTVAEAPPWSFERLNLGEKVGLVFIGIAVALQLALGGFLVVKRLQLAKMEPGDRMMAELSSALFP